MPYVRRTFAVALAVLFGIWQNNSGTLNMAELAAKVKSTFWGVSWVLRTVWFEGHDPRTVVQVDPLTGLHNRSWFESAGRGIERRASLEKKPVAVVAFDLDNLKFANDAIGHWFGDLCLRTAGQIIDRSLRRRSDLGFRWGGDEFVVFLQGTDPDFGCNFGEQVQKSFRETLDSPQFLSRVSADLSQTNRAEVLGALDLVIPRVGLSFGVEVWYADDRELLQTILARADELMYRNKRERKKQRA